MTVTVCGTEEETATLLASVLDGDHTAASLLARAIHQDPTTIEAHTDGLTVQLKPSELGIWIDPIGERLVCRHSVSPANSGQQSLSVVSRFSPRCHQSVHRGPGGGAGGGPPVPVRSALCFGPDRGLSPEHRRARDGCHQPAVQLQRSSWWQVSYSQTFPAKCGDKI